MKKHQGLAVTVSIAVTTALLSFSGASADENGKKSETSKGNSNSTVQEFKGSATRSHGHPIANLTEAPLAGSQQDQNSYVNNDDANSELNWQKWNKVNSKAAAKTLGSIASNPITYHSGGAVHVYTGPVQIIPIWVGTWSDVDKALWSSKLSNLVTSLSPNTLTTAGHVLNTNLGYYTANPPKASVPTFSWSTSGSVALTTTVKDKYGLFSVSDADVARYINLAIKGMQPLSAGVKPMYVYIGASNTRLSSGFGTAYCGWHSIGSLNNVSNIPYIAIQSFQSNPLINFTSACSAQTVSPNANVALDAMASVLVHEIDEALTDPDLRTWYDGRGAENADKCAWTFGTTKLIGAAKYNFTTLDGTNYLIQRNWLADNKVLDSVAGTACALTNP